MSWVGWLFILAALALLLVFVQGIVQFFAWLADEYFLEPRRYRRAKEKPADQPEATDSTRVSRDDTIVERRSEPKKRVVHPASHVVPPRESSRFAKLLKRLAIRIAPKGYDYWVASALSEPDPEIKIEYLSKAIHLNPGYLPAWGLKGHALLSAERYEEAIACFDRSLELHPSALVWYRKGLCCRHLNRTAEALACFDRALEACPRQDRELYEDASRMKQTVQREAKANRAT